MAENDMAGWHRGLGGREVEQSSGDCGRQGVLQSTGSQRVGRNLGTEQHTFTYMRHTVGRFSIIFQHDAGLKTDSRLTRVVKLQIHIPNPVLG